MRSLSPQQIVVGVGTNEHREFNLRQALDLLADAFGDLQISPIYDSLPIPSMGGPHPCVLPTNKHYWNAVVSFDLGQPVSTDNILALRERLRTIESACGRDRSVAEVAMDIDLLLCSDHVFQLDVLRVPSLDVLRCAYVLKPLSELLPDYCCPGSLLLSEATSTRSASAVLRSAESHSLEVKRRFAELWNQHKAQHELTAIDFVWREQLISVAAPCVLL